MKKLLLLSFLFALGLNVKGQVVNNESFDGTTFPPVGWTTSGTYGSSSYLFRTTSGSLPTNSPHTGAGEVEYNSYNIGSGIGNLISPVIDLSGIGANTATVSMWIYRDPGAYNTATYAAEGVTVYANTTAAVGGTALGYVPRNGVTSASGTYLVAGSTLTTTTNGWYQYTFNIPVGFNTATNYIIFSFNSVDGDNTFMDDVQWISYPPTCGGTPNPGNTVASSNPSCTSTPLTLSLQNPQTANGITFQWQTSPNGVTWTSVVGATSSTYTLTQTVATYYRCIVTCTSSTLSATSTALLVAQNPVTSCYCIPTNTYTGYYINNFTITGGITNFNNSSTQSAVTPAWSDYTATISCSQLTGNSVNFSSSFTGGTFGATIWVDWNQNGSFTDAGETMFSTTGYVSSIAGSFVVPAGATGGPTRMRIRVDYLGPTGPAPCGLVAYSEAEDYTFNVIVPVPCSGTPVPGTIATFAPVSVSGFNADVIANGVGSATTSTTADADGAGWYFLDGTYQYTAASAVPTYALPANGIVNSAATPGLSYKLASATGNNSLRLATTNTPGTLTLTTPTKASNVYLLATSGSGAATVDVTVTFTNATTQVFSAQAIPDWFGGAPVALGGIGRVNATNSQDGTATDPRFYQLSLPISVANQANLIASITVNRTSAAGVVHIMGVSVATGTPPAVCAGLTKTLSLSGYPTTTGISIQWQESATLGGPYTNVTTGTGGTTTSYTTAALATTKYYVAKVTCSNSSLSALSNEVAVVVNPLPTLTVTSVPASAVICGSGSVTLTASGTGTSYAWTPATGLSSTTIANPVASPIATTTYTVTASNGTCTNTATKTVTFNPLTTITATATPSTLCAGGNSVLSAVDTNIGGTAIPSGYGISNATSTADEELLGVQLGTGGSLLNNLSTCTTTGSGALNGLPASILEEYSNYTGLPAPMLLTGSTIPFSLFLGTCGGNYSRYASIYIDYNGNGIFDLPTEQVYNSGLISSATVNPTTLTGTFTVPLTASLGRTLMRVVYAESAPTNPTGTYTWGETEDYLVRIAATSTVSASGYTWSPSTFLSSTTGNPVTATNMTASTTYTASGVDANGCIATASVAVTVNPIPAATITPGPTAAFCTGGSITLTANTATGITYQWKLAGSPIVGATASTYVATAAGSYTVTETITSTGCLATSVATVVTVNPLPTVTISPSSASVCIGSGVTLTANGASTYSWSPSAGLSSTTGAVVTASPTLNTTYIVTGTSAAGCVNTANVLVIVNPLPTVSISPAAATTVCAGTATLLTANGALTYIWSPAAGLSATTGTSVTATPATTTNYTVTGTDANGCVNTATKLITVNPLPTIGVTPAGATAVCIGSGVSLTANGATTYTWSPGTGLSATTGATVTASPTITTTYTITGTNNNGCVNSITKTITVNPLPTVSITPVAPTTLCPGNSVALTANGASTYSWTPAAGLSATTGSTVTATPAATTTYTVTGTDVNGCVNTATKQVSIFPVILAISPSTPIAFCGSGSAVLTASGASSYTWSPALGLNTSTGAVVTASPAVTTTYSVTGTDVNGCTNSVSKVITIHPLPTIAVSPATTTTICAASGVVLTASGASTYSWSPATGLSATTGATVTASPIITTVYTITGTDVFGCVNTTTKTVNVLPQPTISITPATATAICNGGSVSLTANGGISYSWSPAAGLSATTGATVIASPTVTTTYTATGTGANGCTNTATKLVTVNPLPVVTVTPSPTAPVCIGSSVTLTGSILPSGLYQWSFGGLPITGATGNTYSASAAGTYTITETNTVTGCQSTGSTLVVVNPLPTVAVTPASSVICGGSGVTLTATGAATYSWSPATGLSATTGASVIASPTGTTTYTVTGTSAAGCINTATALVNINQLPTVSISPAGLSYICPGSSVSLTASGALTYSWAPATGLSSTTTAIVSASPATATIYIVTGTDVNGCVNTAYKAVIPFTAPESEITPSGNIAVCQGDSLKLRAINATYNNYGWLLNGNTIVSAVAPVYYASAAGNYKLVVTDSNGCTSTSAVATTVNVEPRPVVLITTTGVTMDAGAGHASYQWFLNNQIIPGAIGRTYTAVKDGFYTVAVIDSTSLCIGSASYSMHAVGIAGVSLKDAIKIYPNPANTIVHIDAPVTVGVLVSNMQGKLLLRKADVHQIDLTEWADGVYTIVITDKNGVPIRTDKIVKMTK